ncbi:hypothetical protein [Longimicrobium sp.]|jgi:hypothetical protein|uniref:hypothetical protein n=1 Tax=Longimicrobium sp. TaxID=2029185 RepID=UPI002ED9043F
MNTTGASPARLLEMLSDRFGALEAVAYSSIKLSRYVSECEMSMDLLVAEAVLEFADDLRDACAATADTVLAENNASLTNARVATESREAPRARRRAG